MPAKPKNQKKPAEDYAGGGSDFPQEAKDAASRQKGMIDEDMGKYGGVHSKKTPQTVDKDFEHVSGGGSPGSFHGKKQPSNTQNPTPPSLKAVEAKAERKGMVLKPWENNDPTLPDKNSYWLIDRTTELPVIVDPVTLQQIDETLDSLPDET